MIAAAWHVRHLAHEVTHGPAGHEQPGFLAQQLGSASLQVYDRRVVLEDIVADRGVGHSPAHGRRGMRDGVGTEVDEVGHWHRRIA